MPGAYVSALVILVCTWKLCGKSYEQKFLNPFQMRKHWGKADRERVVHEQGDVKVENAKISRNIILVDVINKGDIEIEEFEILDKEIERITHR